MSIADTLVEISHESALNKAERMSLRRIAIEYEKLQAANAKLKKIKEYWEVYSSMAHEEEASQELLALFLCLTEAFSEQDGETT